MDLFEAIFFPFSPRGGGGAKCLIFLGRVGLIYLERVCVFFKPLAKPRGLFRFNSFWKGGGKKKIFGGGGEKKKRPYFFPKKKNFKNFRVSWKNFFFNFGGFWFFMGFVGFFFFQGGGEGVSNGIFFRFLKGGFPPKPFFFIFNFPFSQKKPHPRLKKIQFGVFIFFLSPDWKIFWLSF